MSPRCTTFTAPHPRSRVGGRIQAVLVPVSSRRRVSLTYSMSQ